MLVFSLAEHVIYACFYWQEGKWTVPCSTMALHEGKMTMIGCVDSLAFHAYRLFLMYFLLPLIDRFSPTVGERERLQKQRRPILNTLPLDVKGGRSLD